MDAIIASSAVHLLRHLEVVINSGLYSIFNMFNTRVHHVHMNTMTGLGYPMHVALHTMMRVYSHSVVCIVHCICAVCQLQ